MSQRALLALQGVRSETGLNLQLLQFFFIYNFIYKVFFLTVKKSNHVQHWTFKSSTTEEAIKREYSFALTLHVGAVTHSGDTKF